MIFSKEEIAKLYGVADGGPPYTYGLDWQEGPGWASLLPSAHYTFTVTASGANGGIIPDPPPLPESVCPNCRRDWHHVPLTETVARMCDSLSFDEGYDPGADVSGVVCPGSEYCGPAVSFKQAHGIGQTGTILGGLISSSVPSSAGPDPVQKTYAKLQAMEASLKILLGPAWKDTEPWTFEPGSYTSPTYKDCLKDMLADSLPAINVSTWLTDNLPQAASEAAPKAIEHYKPPKSTGFNFSDFNIPDYSPPKGKKKK